MGRLTTLRPRVGVASSRLKPLRMASRRETLGNTLRKIRFEMWRQDPRCETCGKVTPYPYGFEIDHIVPLEHGGPDDQCNRQLLCVPCHAIKTKGERVARGGMF